MLGGGDMQSYIYCYQKQVHFKKIFSAREGSGSRPGHPSANETRRQKVEELAGSLGRRAGPGSEAIFGGAVSEYSGRGRDTDTALPSTVAEDGQPIGGWQGRGRVCPAWGEDLGWRKAAGKEGLSRGGN